MAWPAQGFPSATKGGDPATPKDLESQKSVPAKNDEAWFNGAIVYRDPRIGNIYRLTDAPGITGKDVGIVAWPKTLTAPTGSIFKPIAEVYSQYLGQQPIPIESPIQTEINGLWGLAQSDATAFATIVGKQGYGGGGLDDTFPQIVTGEYGKLRLTGFGSGLPPGPQ